MESNPGVVQAEASVDASVAAFTVVLAGAVLLFPVLPVELSMALALALVELMMIRCSGLLMGLWMFWPG